MLSAEDRYAQDNAFAALVEALTTVLLIHDCTPDDLDQALRLAQQAAWVPRQGTPNAP